MRVFYRTILKESEVAMTMLSKKKNKKKSIGDMTQNRGVMPPPTRTKESKKLYSRKEGKRAVW